MRRGRRYERPTDTMRSVRYRHQNAQFISPQEVILRDKDEFQIEAVMSHGARRYSKAIISLECQVKYDDSI